MAKAFLLSCQSTHRDKGSLRRRLMMIKTKNQVTLIAKMHRLKIAKKNLNIHDTIHHILVHVMFDIYIKEQELLSCN